MVLGVGLLALVFRCVYLWQFTSAAPLGGLLAIYPPAMFLDTLLEKSSLVAFWHFERAVELNPADESAKENLARARLLLGVGKTR